MKLHQSKAFTLVELIVVITILAILATIAFLSFQGYSKQTRDTSRVADMRNIASGLGIFFSKNGNYPQPDNSININASGTILGYQGYLGSGTMNLIKLGGKGIDPLDSTYYTYYLGTNNKIQLLGYLEQTKESIGITTYTNKIKETYAGSIDYTKRNVYTIGSKLGILLDNSNSPIQNTYTGVDLRLTDSGTIFKGVFDNIDTTISTGYILAAKMTDLKNSSKLRVTDFFGDNSGKALYQFENNANDTSGNYNGTGSNITYSAGKFANGVITNTTISSLSIPTDDLRNAGTYSSWFSFSGSQVILFGSLSNGGWTTQLQAAIQSNGNINVLMGDETSTYKLSYLSSTTLSNGWHNFVISTNGTYAKIYMDGNLISSRTITSGVVYRPTLYIGQAYRNGRIQSRSNRFIDQVRIFNRALSQYEVAQLYYEQ